MSVLENMHPSTKSSARSRSTGANALVGVALGVGFYLGGGAVAALNWVLPGTVWTLAGAAVLSLLWLLCLRLLPQALVFAGVAAVLLMAIFAIIGPGLPGSAWSPGGFLPATLLMGATSAFTLTFTILSIGVPLVTAARGRSTTAGS